MLLNVSEKTFPSNMKLEQYIQAMCRVAMTTGKYILSTFNLLHVNILIRNILFRGHE